MKYINQASQFIQDNLGFKKDYIELIILTILVLIVFWVLKWVLKIILSHLPTSDKNKFFLNRKMKLALTIISWLIVIVIWGHEFQDFITLISFVSAGATIALKEIILNFFAGIYIKAKRIIEVEDRIEIQGKKGDVIALQALGFEMLEIANGNEHQQSTGKIIHVPNSFIFTETTKNFNKAFKYIWDEIKINVDLDSNIEKTKEILYDILHKNEILKEIPKKMENEVDDVTIEYRIYYNYLEPIIYTRIEDSHVELSLRYLVHPKKIRTVQDQIYLSVLDEYKNGNIQLYNVENN